MELPTVVCGGLLLFFVPMKLESWVLNVGIHKAKELLYSLQKGFWSRDSPPELSWLVVLLCTMWMVFCPVTCSFESGLGSIDVFDVCNVSELFSEV